MSHPEQLAFVSLIAQHFETRFHDSPILEIGSYSVNGSIRSIFREDSRSATEERRYIGADLAEGPGVDIVKSGHEVDFPSNHFGLTISCECFEHNPYWRETFINMIRMTKPEGIVAFTCASRGRLEHGTQRTRPEESPGTSLSGIDYYRNLYERDFKEALDHENHFYFFKYFYISSSKDLYFIGFKKPLPQEKKYFIDEAEIANFVSGVNKIKKLRRTQKGAIKNLIYSIVIDLPFGAMSALLGESSFQNVALKYSTITEYWKRVLSKFAS